MRLFSLKYMLAYGTYIVKCLNVGNTLPVVTGDQQSFKDNLSVLTSKLSENNVTLCSTHFNETSNIINDLQQKKFGHDIDHVHINTTSVHGDDVEDITDHNVLSNLFTTTNITNDDALSLIKTTNMDAWIFDHMGNSEKALKKNEEVLDKINNYVGECITQDIEDVLLHALTTRARILNHLGRYDEGLISADEAIKLNPLYYTALTEKASILAHLERYKEALIIVDKAIKLNPAPSKGEAISVKNSILEKYAHNTTSVVTHKYNGFDDVHVVKDTNNSAKNITSMMKSSTVNATTEETSYDTDNITLIEVIVGSSIAIVGTILGAIVFVYKKCKNSVKLYNHDDLPLASPQLEEQDYTSIKIIGEETNNYGTSSDCAMTQ